MPTITSIKATIADNSRVKALAFTLAGWWVLGAMVLTLLHPLWFFAYCIFTGVVLACALYPSVAVYAMALTFPFIDLQIVFGSVNAPVVDLIGMVALAGLALRSVVGFTMHPHTLRIIRMPIVLPFALFALAAAISIRNSGDVPLSIHYFVRPVVFCYLVYVLVVANIVTTKRTLMHMLWCMYAVGIAIGVYGFAGFFLVGADSFFHRRAVPFDIFGMYPLGSNHNAIAEVMVSLIPIGFFFIVQAKSTVQKKWIFLGVLFMIGVALMTFSRSAWLALGVELLVLCGLYYRSRLRTVLQYAGFACVLAVPLIVYMVFFSSQDFVNESNQNRLVLIDIGLEMFNNNPWFGEGIGTFVPSVEQNHFYMQEFGAALDAHGFILKVGSETGAVGLLAFLGVLGSVLWTLCRTYWRATDDFYRALSISMLMMVAGSIFFQLFQTSYYVAELWFPIGVSLTVAYVCGYRRLRHAV